MAPDRRPAPSVIAAGALFVVAMLAIAFAAAWPIYQTWMLLVPTVAATAIGALIAVAGLLWGWSWWLAGSATVVAYLLAGVPAAFPWVLGQPRDILPTWFDLASGTVVGWKQLVTITLPVGAYQSLFVPVFLLFLVGSVVSFSLVWRARSLDVLAVPVLIVVQFFGLAFGTSALSTQVRALGVTIAAPREALIGLAGFTVSVVFLSYRARARRTSALRRASAASGVRQRGGGWSGRIRRSALSVGAVLVAVAVAVPLLALPAEAQPREVLRTAIDPDLQLRRYVSPLSEYRASFSDDLYDTELLKVTAKDASAEPDRLRLAVMSYYDGQVFRVVDPARGDDEQSSAFARRPAGADRTGDTRSATVTIGAYDGVWMPLAGADPSVAFTGARRQGLTDGYFFNGSTDAAIELGGLKAGDSYTITSEPSTETLASLGSASGTTSGRADEVVPESLKAWVTAQNQPATGAGLAELVTRLRARGYLSHSLTAPAAATWVADLGSGYTFQPSLAGHSVDRIDSLFTALLAKQQETGADEDAALVAAPGDDEQFAVATALVARELGFRSRVVLGFALAQPQDGASDIATCTDGSCTGADLAAWVEVAGTSGPWVSVDVTPQHENPIAPRDERTSDPQLSTVVQQHNASEQPPKQTQPDGTAAPRKSDHESAVDLGWLFAIVRIGGLVLLVLLLLASPAIVVLAAKASRRRSRRRAADATASIAGAWEDYVDTAVDLGLPAPGSRTRTELAREYASPNGHRLALLADAAVFGDLEPAGHESDDFWVMADSERALLTAEFSRWQRIRAALSIRSFARFLGTRRIFRSA